LSLIEELDGRIPQVDHELGPIVRRDPRAQLLATVQGIGPLLSLTIASEIGDITRFSSPAKLVGYAGLAPKVSQSGQVRRPRGCPPVVARERAPTITSPTPSQFTSPAAATE
jgi:transposase